MDPAKSVILSSKEGETATYVVASEPFENLPPEWVTDSAAKITSFLLEADGFLDRCTNVEVQEYCQTHRVNVTLISHDGPVRSTLDIQVCMVMKGNRVLRDHKYLVILGRRAAQAASDGSTFGDYVFELLDRVVL